MAGWTIPLSVTLMLLSILALPTVLTVSRHGTFAVSADFLLFRIEWKPSETKRADKPAPSAPRKKPSGAAIRQAVSFLLPRLSLTVSEWRMPPGDDPVRRGVSTAVLAGIAALAASLVRRLSIADGAILPAPEGDPFSCSVSLRASLFEWILAAAVLLISDRKHRKKEVVPLWQTHR